MNTSHSQLRVGSLRVAVVRKAIKHMHLGVYPPAGTLRVTAPIRVTDETVRLAVISRLSWIRRRQATFRGQSRQSRREMTTGETHYYRGRAYRLLVVYRDGNPSVKLRNNRRLELAVRPGTPRADREAVLLRWYRERLREDIPRLIAKWSPIVGVEVAAWGIKKMRTRWGSCNPRSGRIWLNLELAKKGPRCLEYLVVHELVHLLERRHGEAFQRRMNQAMPHWRQVRQDLNATPLADERWKY